MDYIESISHLGTSKRYLEIQAYVRTQALEGQDSLHIQGRGSNVNRPYGVAVDIDYSTIGLPMIEWLKSIPRNFESMAGSEKRYFSLGMRYVASKDAINFQVAYEPYNTKYGGTFSMDANQVPALKAFWHRYVTPQPTPVVQFVEEVED